MLGASGFLGQELSRTLQRRGYVVIGIARSPEASRKIESCGIASIRYEDDNPDSLTSAIVASDADVLISCLNLALDTGPETVRCAEEAGIRRAIFVSTTSIFTTVPNFSKPKRLAGEEAINSSSIATTIVRPTMIYGLPGDRNMERLLKLMRISPLVLIPGDGSNLIQPVHVSDLAQFMEAIIGDNRSFGESVNVPGPEAMSLRDALIHVSRALKKRHLFLSLPMRPVVRVASLYERLSKRPRIRVEQIERLNEDKAFDASSAIALGFHPRSFSDGIREEVNQLAKLRRT